MKKPTKQQILEQKLADRGIPGKVWFTRKFPYGWMHQLPWDEKEYQRLGYDFRQAMELIEHGTMDFIADFIKTGILPPKK